MMINSRLTAVLSVQWRCLAGLGLRGLRLRQTFGTLSVAVYAFAAGLILFYGIRLTFGLRVAPRIEEEGLDIYEHGEAAYN